MMIHYKTALDMINRAAGRHGGDAYETVTRISIASIAAKLDQQEGKCSRLGVKFNLSEDYRANYPAIFIKPDGDFTLACTPFVTRGKHKPALRLVKETPSMLKAACAQLLDHFSEVELPFNIKTESHQKERGICTLAATITNGPQNLLFWSVSPTYADNDQIFFFQPIYKGGIHSSHVISFKFSDPANEWFAILTGLVMNNLDLAFGNQPVPGFRPHRPDYNAPARLQELMV